MSTAATYLAEAKDARHKLLTGAAVVEVRTELGTTRYQPAEIGQLEAYISRLEREVSGSGKRRAVGAIF